jgi:hypothetical protein
VAVTIWGGTEGSITIIAASIPVLRALVSDVKGSRNRSTGAKFDTTDERRLNTTSLETLSTRKDKESEREAYLHGAYSA